MTFRRILLRIKGWRRPSHGSFLSSHSLHTLNRALMLLLPTGMLAQPFVPTGSMNTARMWHTATLLQNGKVLVAGGNNRIGTLASAELYDPATGTWSTTGSPAIGRSDHTATLLPNGKVLVVGGATDNTSAELYDPTTGRWSTTGRTVATHREHTATLLRDGTVLVAGGDDFDRGPPSNRVAELYDPATGTWRQTGSTISVGQQTATLLPSGKVLVAGGGDTDRDLPINTELYNPDTRGWIRTGSLVGTGGLVGPTATLLPNGRVLFTGAPFLGGPDFANSAELYDPLTGTWIAAGTPYQPRGLHTATLLPSGKVLCQRRCKNPHSAGRNFPTP